MKFLTYALLTLSVTLMIVAGCEIFAGLYYEKVGLIWNGVFIMVANATVIPMALDRLHRAQGGGK